MSDLFVWDVNAVLTLTKFRGLDKVEWDSDGVKKMFLATLVKFEDANEPNSSDKPSSSGTGSGSSDGNTTDKSKNEFKRSDIGPVAGGIVGGCVVVLGAIGGRLFWRKRDKSKKPAAAELPAQDSQQPPPPPSSYEPHEQQKKQLPIHSPAVEAYVPPAELPSNAYNW